MRMITCVCPYAVKHIILAVIIYLCIFKECRATILISFINRYIPSGIEPESIRSTTKLQYEISLVIINMASISNLIRRPNEALNLIVRH